MKKELTYKYRISQTREEAYKLARVALERAEKENSFPVRVDFSFNEGDCQLNGVGRGFEVKLDFSDSSVDLFLDLSFVLRPAKKKILTAIESELSKCL